MSRSERLEAARAKHQEADITKGGARFRIIKTKSGDAENSVTNSVTIRDFSTDSKYVIACSVTAVGKPIVDDKGRIIGAIDTDHTEELSMLQDIIAGLLKGILDKM